MKYRELKRLRELIGATVSQMSAVLGLNGKGKCNHLRAMERGVRPISGTVQKICRYLGGGAYIDENLPKLIDRCLPEIMVSIDVSGKGQTPFIFYTRYPRFLGFLSPAPLTQWAPIETSESLFLCVLQWIDEPPEGGIAILEKVAQQVAKYEPVKSKEELDHE